MAASAESAACHGASKEFLRTRQGFGPSPFQTMTSAPVVISSDDDDSAREQDD